MPGSSFKGSCWLLCVQGAYPLTYSWGCVADNYPNPCFQGALQGTVSGGIWELPVSLLTVDHLYTLIVTVSKGARSSTASLQIKPRPTTVPSGTLARICSPCAAEHSTEQPLTISLSLDSATLAQRNALAVNWSVGQDSINELTNATTAVLAPGLLAGYQGAGALTVVATLTLGSQSSNISLVVQLNQVPVVVGGLVVDTLSAVAPDASFKVRRCTNTVRHSCCKYAGCIENTVPA